MQPSAEAWEVMEAGLQEGEEGMGLRVPVNEQNLGTLP